MKSYTHGFFVRLAIRLAIWTTTSAAAQLNRYAQSPEDANLSDFFELGPKK